MEKQVLSSQEKKEMISNFFDDFFNKNGNNVSITEQESQAIYYDKLIKEFYNTNNMELKTDISKKQIVLLTKLTVFADEYKSELVYRIIEFLLKYSVSKDRKGRKEFSEIFKFANQNEINKDPFSSFKDVMGSRGIY